MPRKPRQNLRLTDQSTRRRPNQKPKPVIKPVEFHTCASIDGCQNIIASWTLPAGYSGSVYCSLHRVVK